MKLNKYLLPIGATIAVGAGAGTYLAVSIGQAASASADDARVGDFWHKSEKYIAKQAVAFQRYPQRLNEMYIENNVNKDFYIKQKTSINNIYKSLETKLTELMSKRTDADEGLKKFLESNPTDDNLDKVQGALQQYAEVLPALTGMIHKGLGSQSPSKEISQIDESNGYYFSGPYEVSLSSPSSLPQEVIGDFNDFKKGIKAIVIELKDLVSKVDAFNKIKSMSSNDDENKFYNRYFLSFSNQLMPKDKLIEQDRTYFVPKNSIHTEEASKDEVANQTALTINRKTDNGANTFWVSSIPYTPKSEATESNPSVPSSSLSSPLLEYSLHNSISDIIDSKNFNSEYKKVYNSAIPAAILTLKAKDFDKKSVHEKIKEIIEESIKQIGNIKPSAYTWRKQIEKELIAPDSKENGSSLLINGIAQYASIYTLNDGLKDSAGEFVDAKVDELANKIETMQARELFTLFPTNIYDVQFGLTVGPWNKDRHPDLKGDARSNINPFKEFSRQTFDIEVNNHITSVHTVKGGE